jgi:hypothetical protein
MGPKRNKARSQTPISIGFEGASAAVEPRWRQIAGPPLTPEGLRLATLGANEEWALGRANRTNRGYWQEAQARSDLSAIIKRDGVPVNIVGGYRFPNAPTVDLAPPRPRLVSNQDDLRFNDDAIPGFLRR